MAYQYPAYREYIEDEVFFANGNNEWSDWILVMKPGKDHGDGWENRLNQEGSRRVSLNDYVTESCGIYELKIRKGWIFVEECIVYIGKSCAPGQDASLRNRINLYCKNGSHKKDLINVALSEEYEMYVRYKTFLSNDLSTKAETKLLGKYNYAWNDKDNGIRSPLI